MNSSSGSSNETHRRCQLAIEARFAAFTCRSARGMLRMARSHLHLMGSHAAGCSLVVIETKSRSTRRSPVRCDNCQGAASGAERKRTCMFWTCCNRSNLVVAGVR